MPAPLIVAAAAPTVSAAAGGGAVAAGGTAVAASSGSAAASSAAVAAKGSNIAAGVKGGSSGMAGKITAAPKVKISPGKMSPLKNASSPTPSKTAPNVKTKNQIQQYKEKKQLEQGEQKSSEKTPKNEKDKKTKDKSKDTDKETNQKDKELEEKKKKDIDNQEDQEQEDQSKTEEQSEDDEEQETSLEINKNTFYFAMFLAIIKDAVELFLSSLFVTLPVVPIVSFIFTLLLTIVLFVDGKRGAFKSTMYMLSLMIEMFAPGFINSLPITSVVVYFTFKPEAINKILGKTREFAGKIPSIAKKIIKQ